MGVGYKGLQTELMIFVNLVVGKTGHGDHITQKDCRGKEEGK
jgi:hypothetical protein